MKRLVGHVDLCGLLFKVYIADKRGEPEIKGCYGLCDVEAQEIYLAKNATHTIRRMILTHEMLHGIYQLAGLGDVLDGVKKKHREESVVRTLTPHIFRAERCADRLSLKL